MPLIPLIAMWPLIISKYTNSSNPLLFMSKILPVKLIITLLICVFVYYVPNFRLDDGEYPAYFFFICLVTFLVNGLVDTTLSLSLMSFFSKISDEALGGTYMTFLTTLTNLGGSYPGTVALFLINWLTRKHCSYYESDAEVSSLATNSINNTCSSTALAKVKNNESSVVERIFIFHIGRKIPIYI